MRMRSTGLGTTELVGEISDITKTGGYIILHIKTNEPVKWHVRAAMNPREMLKIFWLMLKPSRMFYVLTSLFHSFNTVTPLDF
jgi:hypothetical protein